MCDSWVLRQLAIRYLEPRLDQPLGRGTGLDTPWSISAAIAPEACAAVTAGVPSLR
jgi:hypothetical protein